MSKAAETLATEKTGRKDANARSSERPPERSRDFERLIEEHMDLLYAVGLRMTQNPVDAQDLVQNTVVKALRFHDKFKEGTHIKAWLLRILRNTFINDYRRRTRRPMMVELSGRESTTSKAPDPHYRYTPVERNAENLMELLDDEVLEAVESLPDDFRAAVIMAYLQDNSYKEIAEKADCPLGTVMSRLYRSRKLLQAQLEDYARERGLVASEN